MLINTSLVTKLWKFVVDRLNKNPIDKCSGPLLVNAQKLNGVLDLLPCIPGVNRPFNENVRADNEANKALDPEELD
jgi:hypothetical protein